MPKCIRIDTPIWWSGPAGLAAYFVDMTKGVQDQIIARTELSL